MEEKIKISCKIYCNYGKREEIKEWIESDNDAESVTDEISYLIEKYTNCDDIDFCEYCDLFPCREPELTFSFKVSGTFENSSLEKEG